MLCAARTARTRRSPITAAATGIVPSARARRRSHGWRSARPSCCPSLTSTSCSRCRWIGAIAYQNKAVIYDLLFKASSQTMLTIAADPKRLGVRIGFTSVLHTWGSAMTHHPHVHMIVPGGGISLDGTRWIGCRPNYLLPVKVLSRLFRRLMLEMLVAANDADRLQFFGDHAHLADKAAFKAYLAPLHRTKWFVYSKRPFAGPEQVLAYLSRYTHRVAISNSRLIAADETGVTFRYKDYRMEGAGRYMTMTLKTGEFIRRFLVHVLPKGFHRIRHYGLFASGARADNIARARELLAVPMPDVEFVEQARRLRRPFARRVAKRLPHVHHRQANAVALLLAQPVVELRHARLRAILPADPDRPAAAQVAHHDTVAMALADRDLIDADRLGPRPARAGELGLHVLLLQRLDRIPVELQLLGNVLDRRLPTALAHVMGKALRIERVVRQEIEPLALHLAATAA